MTTPEPSSLSAEDAALALQDWLWDLLDQAGHPVNGLVLESLFRAIETSAWLETHDAQIRADERRRAGEREAALRERVEALLAWPVGRSTSGVDRLIPASEVRAALAADEPEAAEGGAERPQVCPKCERQPECATCALMWADGVKPYWATTPPGRDESPGAGAREEA